MNLFESSRSKPVLCAKGCGRPVKAIYCPEHKEQAAQERAAAKEAQKQAMRELWKKDPAGMKAKIAAGKAKKKEAL